ncbi:Mu-like prophage major head subunit gpT family protein [Candidatus Dojkabacteria bacterium]|jgi:phage major head subunit gpT-like protein|nr:Mu-like prophage major head subunit gpT family protein [Candidatus Dojkabacteria bacterium]
MENRQKWTDLIPDTGLKIMEVYDQGDEQYTPGIFSILKSTSGTGAQENYTGKTSFGKVSQFEDGDDVPTIQRFKTYTTKVIFRNYGGAVEVTKNLIEDRDFSSELDEMKDMSRSVNYSVDESGAQLLNGGFATTVAVNGYDMTWYNDGKPQFSTIHPTVVPGASTQSNASSTGIVLSHDNLETARLALMRQKTDNGLAMGMAGKLTLATSLDNEKLAKEIFGSDLQPQNANNAVNVFKGAMDLVTSTFLDTTNGGLNSAWFLMNLSMAKLYQVSRQEKRLESDVNIRNKVVTYTVDARWANCSKEWKGTWGSKGNNAAYSS